MTEAKQGGDDRRAGLGELPASAKWKPLVSIRDFEVFTGLKKFIGIRVRVEKGVGV